MKNIESPTMEPTPTQAGIALTLPLGLLGFEPFKRYVLLSRPEEAPFLWLQVLEHPQLAFVVVSPTVAAADYEPHLAEEDVSFLDLRSPEDALIFNIVTLRAHGEATVNLKGPVVVNRRTLIGKQVIPQNAADLSVAHPIPVIA